MSAVLNQHYDNANFLRELAENLPAESKPPERIALLNRAADVELAQAQHVEWVKAKITAAERDTRRPGTQADVEKHMTQWFEDRYGL